MFLALSTFSVANGVEGEVRRAFLERPHLVDGAPGFVRMEVAQAAADASEFWLLTWWDEEDSFRRWHRSHDYHEAHAGIPRGLKLVPGRTRVVHLEVFAE